MIRSFAALILVAAMAAAPAPSAAGVADAKDLFSGAWLFYRAAFLTDDGRIVDNANGNISHSEGQGYGMLLAAAAEDRKAFDLIWGWTRDNLMVRNDRLAAWRWDPAADPPVSDTNNASDGDLLLAWALLRAYRAWSDPEYFTAAKAIALDLASKAVVDVDGEYYLLPGADGFMSDNPETGPVLNLSYWIFPAFEEMRVFAPEFPADELMQSGLRIAGLARFGDDSLPADWAQVTPAGFEPADEFPHQFGYNAIRVPLYLAWSGGADVADLLTPYADVWSRMQPGVIDLASGEIASKMHDVGYEAIVNLVACAHDGTAVADPAATLEMVHYYPSTLSMLSLLAMVERYPECLEAH